MKILSLPNKVGRPGLLTGVLEEAIDKNDRYEVSVYYLPTGAELNIKKNYFRAYYVLDGFVNVSLPGSENRLIDTKMFNAGKGWLVLPAQSQVVKAEIESKIFVISSSFTLNDIEITDRARKTVFRDDIVNELSDYIVNKPWGNEQWFVDTGVFVFKGIKMNSSYECSLQLHEHKIEVNLILSGKVRLILGYDSQISAAILQHHENGGNQGNFSMSSQEVDVVKNTIKPILFGPGEGWKAKPYEIHQVLSLDTYFALEVSTPEVDDIIRLKDLYNRPGGRIDSEHRQNKLG